MAKQYRLTLLEDDTHKSIRSLRFTKLSLSLAAGSISVLAIILIYCIVAFSPLHYTIPGFPDAHSRKVAIDNAIKIDSLENTITRWEVYADNLGRVLTGAETINIDSIVSGDYTRYLSARSKEEVARQDSILRDKVHKAEQFGVSTGSTRNISIEGMHFFQPLKGVVSNGFDAFNHPGIDITAKSGDMVYAILDGTVINSSWDEENWYSVQIQHPGEVVSSFTNCMKLLVKKGDKIKAGTPVAILGSTGSPTKGDYLHFELWYKGDAVDPVEYMNF